MVSRELQGPRDETPAAPHYIWAHHIWAHHPSSLSNDLNRQRPAAQRAVEMRLSLVAVACFVGLLSFTAAASAQDRSAPSGAPSIQAPNTTDSNVPDAKLDAVAAAVKTVFSVNNDYEQRIAGAPEEEKRRLITEGTQAVSKAVTDNGLSVAEYTAILEVAHNNPAVRDKILQRLK